VTQPRKPVAPGEAERRAQRGYVPQYDSAAAAIYAALRRNGRSADSPSEPVLEFKTRSGSLGEPRIRTRCLSGHRRASSRRPAAVAVLLVYGTQYPLRRLVPIDAAETAMSLHCGQPPPGADQRRTTA
jgi:hypothetical protein